MSMFFASSFQNVFQAQEKLEGTQGHFVINNIIQDKFTNLKKAWEIGTPDPDYVVFQNKTEEGILPFTYIGLDTAKLVFKDFFMFKGMYEGTSSTDYDVKNPAGITKVGLIYYVVAPLENKIYECSGTGAGSCPTYIEGDFKNPIGITTNGTDTLFVADAGNNRIVKITDLGNEPPTVNMLKDGLNFPVGIDFYNDGTNDYLFFSESYKNKVYRVKTDGTGLKIVVGDGDNEDCDNSALYCKLDFPTGVFADDSTDSLYIADTGNNRVLKVSDPGINIISNFPINLKYPQDILLDHIKFGFSTVSSFTSEPTITSTSLHKGAYSVSGQDLTYDFFTQLSSNIMINCTGGDPLGDPPTGCTNQPYTSLQVNDGLFENNDVIRFASQSGPTFTIGSVASIPDFTYLINGDTTGHASGEIVYLNDEYLEKTEDSNDLLNIDLSQIYSSTPSFMSVDIEFYDQSAPSTTINQSIIIRSGNGILGTPEDIIEDTTPASPPANYYPTGVYWNGSLQVGDGVAFNTTDATFDYTTDFDISSLNFDKLNGDKILQATVTADGKEYIINGAIQ